MRYNQLEYFSVANGVGVRTVLWVQGCEHHCKECHNPETWNFTDGHEYTKETENKIIESLKPSYIKGITFSGGDPLHPKNIDTITELAKHIREVYPDKSIWCYTGYLRDEIKDKDIVNYLDVLVDGEFHIDEKNITLPFCGSENQKVIDVKKTLLSNKIVLLNIN